MKIFISGGCKNGKSYFAQSLAKQLAEKSGGPLYYIATMIPCDEEDRARIRRHIEDRAGWGFETIEQGRNIKEIFDKAYENGTFLLDSVTALLANEMFDSGDINRSAYLKIAEELKYVAGRASNIVFVSDYIYSDAVIYDELSEDYRRGLGYIDRALAGICDRVTEVAYGQLFDYKR